MESCCSQLLELDHGGFTSMHPFGGHGSYEAFKEVRAGTQVRVPLGGVLCAGTLCVLHTHTHTSTHPSTHPKATRAQARVTVNAVENGGGHCPVCLGACLMCAPQLAAPILPCVACLCLLPGACRAACGAGVCRC